MARNAPGTSLGLGLLSASTRPGVCAALIFGGFVGVWWARGAHRGITRDTEFRQVPDPVTGLVAHVPTPVWLPGWDFLVVGVMVAAAAAVVAAVVRRVVGRRSASGGGQPA